MEVSRNSIYNFLLFLGAVIICIWPAIENGYPILFSDAGTYIQSGHVLEVPLDRPIFYGLFVRHISMSWSLWLVILAQSALLCFLLLKTIQNFLQPQKSFLLLFLLTFILGMCTGVGYYTAQVSPDIFTVIGFLSVYLLLFTKKMKLYLKGFISLILCFSVVSHYSNIPILLGTTIFSWIVFFILYPKELKSKKRIKQMIYPLVVILLSFPLISLTNNYLGAGYKLSRVTYTVNGARFIEAGLVNKYLKRVCNQGETKLPYGELCQYIDQFDRWPAAGFYLHSEDSPLYDGECSDKSWKACWLEKNKTYKDLIQDILAEEDLFKDYIAIAASGTLKQFFLFEQSKIDPFPFNYLIEEHFHDDLHDYNNALQQSRSVYFNDIGMKEGFITIFCFFFILIALYVKWRELSPETKTLTLTILALLLINATICATLSNVVPRYQGRVIFLIPILVYLGMLKWIKKSDVNIHLNQIL